MNNEMQHWAAMGENKLLLIVGKYPCKVSNRETRALVPL